MGVNKKGFTLTELVVVVAIMGIMVAVVVPSYLSYQKSAEAQACRANLEIIRSAIKEWALDNPGSLTSHNVTVDEIDTYIDDGFDSLECDDGNYFDDQTGDGLSNDDWVVTTDADGNIPLPTCDSGLAGHSL